MFFYKKLIFCKKKWLKRVIWRRNAEKRLGDIFEQKLLIYFTIWELKDDKRVNIHKFEAEHEIFFEKPGFYL